MTAAATVSSPRRRSPMVPTPWVPVPVVDPALQERMGAAWRQVVPAPVLAGGLFGCIMLYNNPDRLLATYRDIATKYGKLLTTFTSEEWQALRVLVLRYLRQEPPRLSGLSPEVPHRELVTVLTSAGGRRWGPAQELLLGGNGEVDLPGFGTCDELVGEWRRWWTDQLERGALAQGLDRAMREVSAYPSRLVHRAMIGGLPQSPALDAWVRAHDAHAAAMHRFVGGLVLSGLEPDQRRLQRWLVRVAPAGVVAALQQRLIQSPPDQPPTGSPAPPLTAEAMRLAADTGGLLTLGLMVANQPKRLSPPLRADLFATLHRQLVRPLGEVAEGERLRIWRLFLRWRGGITTAQWHQLLDSTQRQEEWRGWLLTHPECPAEVAVHALQSWSTPLIRTRASQNAPLLRASPGVRQLLLSAGQDTAVWLRVYQVTTDRAEAIQVLEFLAQRGHAKLAHRLLNDPRWAETPPELSTGFAKHVLLAAQERDERVAMIQRVGQGQIVDRPMAPVPPRGRRGARSV